MAPSPRRPHRSWAERARQPVPLLIAMLAAPVAAQVPTDRPTGSRDTRASRNAGTDEFASRLAAFAGRRVAAIDLTGHNVTKDWVIAREIRTKVGNPLDVEAVGRDVARLDNLSIFAEIRVDAFGFHFHFANGTKPKAQRARLR